MKLPFTYQSIEAASEGLYKEKGSKFLAYAFPVETEGEIKDRLNELRKKHFDARHHCYAWRLGPAGDHFRTNDDQEPSGTAGKPIYGQLLSFNLTNCLVVVVRYFGGTKLGAGGLIHAYKTAAAGALNHAKVREYDVLLEGEMEFPYTRYNDIMRLLREHEAQTGEQLLEDHSKLFFTIPGKHLEKFRERCIPFHDIKLTLP